MKALGIWIIAGWIGGCAAAGAAANGVASDAGGDETEALRRQVVYLSEALAEARAEVDSLIAIQSANDKRKTGRVSEDVDQGPRARTIPEGVDVVDVSRDLRMVALGAGRKSGIRNGMVFAVIRGEKMISRIRVVDVRSAVAGAVIEKTETGKFPEKGDRVLLEGRQELGE